MKKLFIFLCIALVFIMVSSSFLSIGKIFDKDPDKTEAPGFITLPGTEAPEPEPFTVYSGTEAITDLSQLSDPKYNRTVVYYFDESQENVYFAFLFNDSILDKATFMNDMVGKDINGVTVLNKITYNFESICDLGLSDVADHRNYLSEDDFMGFMACIFFSIPYDSGLDYAHEAEMLLTDMGPWLTLSEPGEVEGPSADVTTPVTTEPQIYPNIPQGPGAE